MLEDVLQNRHHILLFIQFDVLQKKSVEEAYQNFCNVLGENVMSYNDFDFWFYHFLNGNFDLDYDRSKAPKLRGLSDISVDIAEKIVDKLDWKEKCIFRDVSKKCREVVDKNPLIIRNVRLISREPGLKTVLSINWTPYEYPEFEVKYEREAKKYEKLAVKDLALALRNPNLRVRNMTVFIKGKELGDYLNKLLKSLNRQIHVESFDFAENDTFYWEIESEEKVMKILPYLKPKVLERIEMSCTATGRGIQRLGIQLEEIVKLDQWKNAKRANIGFSITNEFEDWTHFNHLFVELSNPIKFEDVIRLKDIYLNSPNFQISSIKGTFEKKENPHLLVTDEERIRKELGGDKFPMSDGSILHVEISNYFGTTLVFKKNKLMNDNNLLTC